MYNNKVHTSTQVSPFFANYGLNPRMGIEPRQVKKSEEALKFTEQMKTIHEEAEAAVSKARDNMQRYADLNRGQAPIYKIGDKVWLSAKDLKLNRPARKLSERQLGPFKIIKVVSPNEIGRAHV